MEQPSMKKRPIKRSLEKRRRSVARAQAAVEFALIAPVVLVLLLVGIQFFLYNWLAPA